MKIPRVIKWGFDPFSSGIAALSTETGRRVWGAIRVNHVVDQYFNDDVETFAREFDSKPASTVDELFRLAKRCNLQSFGAIDARGNNLWVRDNEWWGELLDALHGRLAIGHQFTVREIET